MWLRCLLCHLGWLRASKNHERIPEAGYYAPSWSWAAITDKVFVKQVDNADSELVGHKIELSSPGSPLEQVASAMIVVCGRCLNAEEWQEWRNNRSFVETIMDHDLAETAYQNRHYLYLGLTAKKDGIGLILQQVGDRDFQRIGYFSFWGKWDTWNTQSSNPNFQSSVPTHPCLLLPPT